jgi:hypothetical protein
MSMPGGPTNPPNQPPSPGSPYPQGPFPGYDPAPSGPAGYNQPPGSQGYVPPPPPGPQGYVPPPPVRRSNRRGYVIGGVAVLILVLIFGGYLLFRNQLSGGVNELQVGDCFDEPISTTSVSDVQHHPCTDPHDAEVFLVITDPTTGDYPGVDHFRSIANTQCADAASTYLGIDFNSRDDIGGGFFYPSTDSWTNSSDRTVTCYLDRSDGGQLSGPLRGIGASPLP